MRSISMENAAGSNDRQPRRTDVCGVEMLHSLGVVAKIVRRLADREVNPQPLRRFQPRRGQGGFHPFEQAVVIAGDGTAPDQIVVASSQHRRDLYRAFEACTGLVEAAELGRQCPSRSWAMAFFGSTASICRNTCSAS